MDILLPVLLLVFYIAVPVLAVLARKRWPSANPIIPAYVAGIALGASGLLPESVLPFQDLVSSVAVALSIPLMLYSANMRSLARTGRTALLSLGLAVLAVLVMVTSGRFIFGPALADPGGAAGLLVGVYTGGTPNLAAIRAGLNVDSSTFLAVHTADLLVGALYVLFVVTIAQRIFLRFLPAYPIHAVGAGMDAGTGGEGSVSGPRLADLGGVRASGPATMTLADAGWKDPALAIALTLVIVGASLGIGELVSGPLSTAVLILALTTFSLIAAAFPRVSQLKGSFTIGEFAVYIFCVVVGSMADLERVLDASGMLIMYVAWVVFGSLLLHLLLARLFKVDADTVIVTSTAAICSPPFIGLVAVSLKNRHIIPAGIAVGIIGYALGNYAGIGVGLLLR